MDIQVNERAIDLGTIPRSRKVKINFEVEVDLDLVKLIDQDYIKLCLDQDVNIDVQYVANGIANKIHRKAMYGDKEVDLYKVVRATQLLEKPIDPNSNRK